MSFERYSLIETEKMRKSENTDILTVAANAEAVEETHPWAPFIPDGAKALFMGTFPPGPHRWAMDFFYPNPTNDFWKVMGLVYFGSPEALYNRSDRRYRLEDIMSLLRTHGIAMGDTGAKVRRLRGNASDKYLEITEPVNLDAIMHAMPACRAIATTGEKAAGVLAGLTATQPPAIGEFCLWKPAEGRVIEIWRLPSTSRAYPLALDKKAVFYADFLRAAGCLP